MSELAVVTVAIVAEGPTDQTVLQAITRVSAGPAIRFLSIQPESSDAFGGFGPHGSGWKGVRSWCNEAAATVGGIHAYMSSRFGPQIHLLLVHVDADIAGDPEIGVQKPCPPACATTNEIRKIVSTWLGCDVLPPQVLAVVPSKSTEAWILAALVARDNESIPNIECIMEPARRLTRSPFKYLRTRDGEPKKEQHVYTDVLAPEAAARWQRVCELCWEASRFAHELAAAMKAASE